MLISTFPFQRLTDTGTVWTNGSRSRKGQEAEPLSSIHFIVIGYADGTVPWGDDAAGSDVKVKPFVQDGDTILEIDHILFSDVERSNRGRLWPMLVAMGSVVLTASLRKP